MRGITAAVAFMLTVGSLFVSAAMPPYVNYQGRLMDGTNLVNGSVGLTLRLYDAIVGGSLLYEDSNNVDIVDGLYSTFLGDDTVSGTLTGALSSGTAYLEVSVNGAALEPRERVVSVGYALNAGDVPGNVFWRASGNAAVSPNDFLGTLNDEALSFRVQGRQAFMLVPHATSPQILGGHSNNYIGGSSYGSVIGGGGSTNYPNRISILAPHAVIAGGRGNVVGDGGTFTEYSVIGGGESNTVVSQGTTVAGGQFNAARGVNSTVGGGNRNLANGNSAVVGGGSGNRAVESFATVAGGEDNVASNRYATVPGGNDNTANGRGSFAAGQGAGALHDGAFVWADNSSPMVFNSSGSNQFIIRARGGVGINTNAGFTDALTVNGGIRASEAVHAESFVGEGSGLTMVNGTNLIAGSVSNAAIAPNAVTGDKIRDGTISNADVAANTFWGTGGNAGTTAGTHYIGTSDNRPFEIRANALRVFLASPSNGAPNLTMGSPDNSIFSGTRGSSILGGSNNTIDVLANYSTVAGGSMNYIGSNAVGSAIGGGNQNRLTNTWFSVIAGGATNSMGEYSDNSVIGGGNHNSIGPNAEGCVIAGGRGNTISNNADFGTIAGGWSNVVSAQYAFAAGRQARALHRGSFVWADSQNDSFRSTASNQFLIRADRGVGINTTNPIVDFRVFGQTILGSNIQASILTSTNVLNLMVGQTTNSQVNGITFWEQGSFGMSLGYDGTELGNDNKLAIYSDVGVLRFAFKNNGYLGVGVADPTNRIHVFGGAQCNGSTWINASDRNLKENFEPVNPAEILEKVVALPISEWSYKMDDNSSRHVGPIAQDFYAAFRLGDNDTGISTVDPAGVALAAIQGLHALVQQKDAEILELKARLERLEAALGKP
ncbi:MAG: hypothetical protein BWY59_01096 [Verrucomicrobia bacterium ADurb.Bin345]|nr:MAG: hypothetical protein BWY59_01096 [Verrucomicrobia bacterium ADurb.Bin345]